MNNKPPKKIKTSPYLKVPNSGAKDILNQDTASAGMIPLYSGYREVVDEDMDFLVDLADELDDNEMEKEANFVDFLIKKFAETYSNPFKDLEKSLLNYHKIYGDEVLDSFAGKFYREYTKVLEETGSVSVAARKANDKVNSIITKKADTLEQNPVYVSDSIIKIIRIMIASMDTEKRVSSYNNIKDKVDDFNIEEMSKKRRPGGAAIGVSLALIKNILNSRDQLFIKVVLDDLKTKLGNLYD